MRLYFVVYADGTLKVQAKGSSSAYMSLGGARTALSYVKKFYNGMPDVDKSKIMYADITLKDLE